MPHVAARTASRDRDTGRYQSHRPEQTLLYQIVDEYYPAFAALMAEQGKELPGYVQRKLLISSVLPAPRFIKFLKTKGPRDTPIFIG
uniref:Putative transposase n=1 Tax=Kingella kingae KKC2005004457 TaxID=1229911 RepID=T0MES4_KINKI|nr:Putative transposase [Kingella kingae KKC2005004457]